MPTSSAPSISGVSHRLSHGNLHINLAGEFGMSHSSAVLGLLERHYAACNKIFIDVRKVDQPNPLARGHFQKTMPRLAPDPRKVFFKGKAGFSLALNGNRVLITPDHGAGHNHEHEHHHHQPGHVCKNNCPNCKCKHKHQ